MPPNPAIDKPAQLSKHVAQQDDLAAQHLQSALSHLRAPTLAAESRPLATPTLASTQSFGELLQQKISPFF